MVKEYLEINPEMDAGEVLRRTQQISAEQNPYRSEKEREREETVNALRDERLRRQGQNPTEWTYYGVAKQPNAGWNTPFTEEDMEITRAHFPQGIELLVSQGHIAPASEQDLAKGREFYDMQHFWELFIRIMPENPHLPQGEEHTP